MAYNPSNPNGQAPSISSAPVVIASDQTAVNTTLQESIAGGATVYHLVSANNNNLTNFKQGQSKVTGWYIYNSNQSARKLNFHNLASAPATAATSLYFSIVIPPLSAANCPFPAGIDFSTGISISTTSGLTDADTGVVGTSDLIINIFYK